MAIINDLYQPEYAFLCIGDFYTMGPVQAAYAVNKVIRGNNNNIYIFLC